MKRVLNTLQSNTQFNQTCLYSQKIFKNSQTDAILPKPQVRQKCNKEQSYKKKISNVQDTKRKISHSLMTLAVSASHLLLMKKVYLATSS